ncbi:MAG TPA: preprotein translocase subunit SecE [Patescibacteria group bacterium]
MPKLKSLVLDNRLSRYIIESKRELKKVVWPTRKETMNHTFIVIVISLGVAIFLGALDFVFSFGIERLLLLR